MAHALTLVAIAAAVPLMPRIVFGQAGPFKLDPLPYANNALEPHIDARTMEIHHGRHHAAYVNNLNKLAKDTSALAQDAARTTCWRSWQTCPRPSAPASATTAAATPTTPCSGRSWASGGGKPTGDVAAAIDRDLGGFDKFQNDFNAAGGRVFGSGWVFVTVDADGKLAIGPSPTRTRR